MVRDIDPRRVLDPHRGRILAGEDRPGVDRLTLGVHKWVRLVESLRRRQPLQSRRLRAGGVGNEDRGMIRERNSEMAALDWIRR